MRSYEFAKRLVSDGINVTIITSSQDSKQKELITNSIVEGIKVVSINCHYSNNFGTMKRIYAFLKFSLLSSFIILQNRYDRVLATSTPLTVGIPALINRFFKKQKYIFEVRDLWPKLPIEIGAIKNKLLIRFLNFFEKMIYKNSSRIIALSPGMKAGILEKCSNKEITVIPNSSDTEFFKCVEKPVEFSNFLLYPGTIGEINGVSVLNNLALELKNKKSKYKILVIGDGKDKEKCIYEAKKLNVFNEKIFYLDAMPKEVIRNYINNSLGIFSLFIDLPEMRNNSANKFFDCLAAKKPIFINYLGWHKDIIDDNKNGLCFYGLDPKETVEMLQEFLESKEYDKACRNSYELALNDFNRDKLYKKFKNVILK